MCAVKQQTAKFEALSSECLVLATQHYECKDNSKRRRLSDSSLNNALLGHCMSMSYLYFNKNKKGRADFYYNFPIFFPSHFQDAYGNQLATEVSSPIFI